jgi:hypothetical protein
MIKINVSTFFTFFSLTQRKRNARIHWVSIIYAPSCNLARSLGSFPRAPLLPLSTTPSDGAALSLLVQGYTTHPLPRKLHITSSTTSVPRLHG